MEKMRIFENDNEFILVIKKGENTANIIASIVSSIVGGEVPHIKYITGIDPTPTPSDPEPQGEDIVPSFLATAQHPTKINFGKYAGKTIEEVYEKDPQWLRWVINASKNWKEPSPIIAEIEEFLAQK